MALSAASPYSSIHEFPLVICIAVFPKVKIVESLVVFLPSFSLEGFILTDVLSGVMTVDFRWW